MRKASDESWRRRFGSCRADARAGFLKHGHHVALGTREPQSSTRGERRTPERKSSRSPSRRVRRTRRARGRRRGRARGAGARRRRRIAGKTVIDACNPIGGGPPVNGVLSFFTTLHRLADGAAAEGLPAGPFRQGVQQRRRRADGQSAFRRRPADDVHLRQRRRRQSDGD